MQTVKQAKKRIAKKDFEQVLFEKYPSLFDTGTDGKLLPLRCANDCPKGWETIVDHLFGSFVDYIQNTSRAVKNPNRKFMNFVNDLIQKFNRKISLHCNPKNIFWKKVRRLTGKIQNFLHKQQLYVYTNPPAIKIGQFKEKFGCLRIYIDGGDETVQGMIAFAEYLSKNTCQYTGKPGLLVQKKSWYATLSPKEAARLGYGTVPQ